MGSKKAYPSISCKLLFSYELSIYFLIGVGEALGGGGGGSRDKKTIVNKIVHTKLKIELHEAQKYSVKINQVMVATIIVLLSMICTMIGLINILLFKHVGFFFSRKMETSCTLMGGRNRSM